MITRRLPHHGFSLIEVIISVVIIGGLAAAVLNTIGATAMMRRLDADRVRAEALAQDLLEEIAATAYEDPDANDGSFGPGSGETGVDRSLFDDVDDYHGWSSSPPERRAGSALSGYDGWTRSVSVAWARTSDPRTDEASDSRLKRITVTIHRGDRLLATATALRSAAMDEMR